MNTFNPFNIFCISLYLNFILLFSAVGQSIGINLCKDTWGNVYKWDHHSIEKYDAVQHLFFRNGNLSFGQIHKLGLVQPQKPFVFFEETQKIVFLDNTLSENGEPISLQTLLPQSWVTQVSGSILGGFWCFDQMNLRIVKMDQRGNVLFEIENLPQYNLLSDWNALGMVEHKNTLYTWDHNNLYGFDLLGGISMQIPTHESQLLFDNGQIYRQDSSGFQMLIPTQRFIPVGLPVYPYCIDKDKIIVWDKLISQIPLE